MNTVVVGGSTSYTNLAMVIQCLDAIREEGGIKLVIQGGGQGADRFARDWCKVRQVKYKTIKANPSFKGGWGSEFKRDARMLDHNPNVVLVFGHSRRGNNLARAAKERGIDYVEVPD